MRYESSIFTLKGLRTRAGLTVRVLAGMMGYDPATVEYYESEGNKPPKEFRQRASEVFRVPEEFILYAVPHFPDGRVDWGYIDRILEKVDLDMVRKNLRRLRGNGNQGGVGMASKNGVIEEVGPKHRQYYTCEDVMALFGVGRSKAYGMVSSTRKAFIASGGGIDYPPGKCPKRLFNQRYMIE